MPRGSAVRCTAVAATEETGVLLARGGYWRVKCGWLMFCLVRCRCAFDPLFDGLAVIVRGLCCVDFCRGAHFLLYCWASISGMTHRIRSFVDCASIFLLKFSRIPTEPTKNAAFSKVFCRTPDESKTLVNFREMQISVPWQHDSRQTWLVPDVLLWARTALDGGRFNR